MKLCEMRLKKREKYMKTITNIRMHIYGEDERRIGSEILIITVLRPSFSPSFGNTKVELKIISSFFCSVLYDTMI
jgi:hypothetical protein